LDETSFENMTDRETCVYHLEKAFAAKRAVILILYEVEEDEHRRLQGCNIPRLTNEDEDEEFKFCIRSKVADLFNLRMPEQLLPILL